MCCSRPMLCEPTASLAWVMPCACFLDPQCTLLRALWPLLDGTWDVLEGSWGVLVVVCSRLPRAVGRLHILNIRSIAKSQPCWHSALGMCPSELTAYASLNLDRSLPFRIVGSAQVGSWTGTWTSPPHQTPLGCSRRRRGRGRG